MGLRCARALVFGSRGLGQIVLSQLFLDTHEALHAVSHMPAVHGLESDRVVVADAAKDGGRLGGEGSVAATAAAAATVLHEPLPLLMRFLASCCSMLMLDSLSVLWSLWFECRDI